MVYTPASHRWDETWGSSGGVAFEQSSTLWPIRDMMILLVTALVITTTTWWILRYRRKHSPRSPTSQATTISPPLTLQSTGDDAPTPLASNKPKPTITIYIDALFHSSKKILDLEKENCPPFSLADLPKGFLDLCRRSKMIFLSKVESDHDEALVLDFLKTKLPTTFWENVELPLHRILFSSSTEGRVSMVRQINPMIHFDTEATVVTALTGKISNAVLMNHETLDTTLQDSASVVKSLE